MLRDLREERGCSKCQRCANVGRFGAKLLLFGFAPGCERTHWHGRAQESNGRTATAARKIDKNR